MKIYELFILLFDSTPLRWIFLLPYRFGEVFICNKLQDENTKVWTRNSYYLKTLVVIKSDLDVTISFLKSPSSNEIQNKIKKYKKYKKFLPFLGELNIICQNDLSFIQKSFNHYEAARDPHLAKIVNLNKHPSSERATFLLRMFEADRHNLSNKNPLRLKKWRSHLSDCSIGSTEDLVPTLFEKLVELTHLDREDLLHYLTEYLNNDFKPNEKMSLVLYPAQWAVWANINGGTSNLVDSFSLNTMEKKIILSGLRWEIMGLYTQFRILPAENNVSFFTELIQDLIVHISKDFNENIDDDIMNAKTLCLMVNNWS